jgi:hypothetical protein
MASNAQKVNFGVRDKLTGSTQSRDRDHNIPKQLPVSIKKVGDDGTNGILTLKFETQNTPYNLPEVTIPVTGPEYIRYPWQVGDKGFVTAADLNMGGISALGANGPANFSQAFNLSSLVFTPAGSKKWTKTDDKTALVNYGKTGTVNRDINKKSKHVVHPDSGIATSTGAQGQTGPESNPTYNITRMAHPKNGVADKTVDKDNGDHTFSLVPSGGSGTIGALLSAFGGKHKMTLDQSGASINSSSKVNIKSPQNNLEGDTNVKGMLSATGGMSAGGGSGGGSGAGGGGVSANGGLFGTSAAIEGPATVVGPVTAIGITNESFFTQTAYQYAVPLTGDTVTLSTTTPICIIDPAGTLAALTVAFPDPATDTTVVDGTLLSFSSTQKLTALTLSGGSASFCFNAPTAVPTTGGQYRWLYNATNTTWFLI